MKVNKMIYIEIEYLQEMERLIQLHKEQGNKIGVSKIIEVSWNEMKEKLKLEGYNLEK